MPSPALATARLGSPKHAARRVWIMPAMVFLLLSMQLVICTVIITFATSDRSFSVEPDYYKKAIDWDRHSAEQRASAALGWRLTAALASDVDENGLRTLTCALSDADGAPIVGATVVCTAFHHARGQQRSEWTLTESGGGRYTMRAPLRRAGVWEMRFIASRGEERFVHTELVEAPLPPQSAAALGGRP